MGPYAARVMRLPLGTQHPPSVPDVLISSSRQRLQSSVLNVFLKDLPNATIHAVYLNILSSSPLSSLLSRPYPVQILNPRTLSFYPCTPCRHLRRLSHRRPPFLLSPPTQSPVPLAMLPKPIGRFKVMFLPLHCTCLRAYLPNSPLCPSFILPLN